MNKEEMIREALSSPEGWYMSDDQVAKRISCSSEYVRRLRKQMSPPKETRLEMSERKIISLVREFKEDELHSFYISLASSGIMQNALNFYGEDVVNEMLSKSKVEKPQGNCRGLQAKLRTQNS